MALVRIQASERSVSGFLIGLTFVRPKRAALINTSSCIAGFAVIDDPLTSGMAVGEQGIGNTDEHG
jgi:hypothetical protein